MAHSTYESGRLLEAKFALQALLQDARKLVDLGKEIGESALTSTGYRVILAVSKAANTIDEVEHDR